MALMLNIAEEKNSQTGNVNYIDYVFFISGNNGMFVGNMWVTPLF